MRCSMGGCSEIAETNLTWLVGTENGEQRTGGNFCGSCAAMAWNAISVVPRCVSSAIVCAAGEVEGA